MMETGHIVFNKMDEVIFGKPASQALEDVITRLGVSRIFLMVSGTLNRETDEIEKIRCALGPRCVGTFDSMPAHTSRSAVVAASNQARELKADLILTVGGGSVTDGAKAVQLCLANDVTKPEQMDMFRSVPGPDGKPHPPDINPPSVRQVSIPTTLSGGEFSAIAGITNEETKTKELYRHPFIIPQAVIMDPTITVHTPEWLWLSTGIRAIDNCVEGVCSNFTNTYGDALGLQGIRVLSKGLRKVKADPDDLEARLDCQVGAWLSAGPFSCGAPMGASHGIGYILGAMYDVPHGHTSCVMLPSVMRWNKDVNAERQAMVAAAMGDPKKEAGDLLEDLIRDLDMPCSLKAVGVTPTDFEKISEASMAVPWIPLNPRAIPSSQELKEILELAK